jgi:hypothetical protein
VKKMKKKNLFSSVLNIVVLGIVLITIVMSILLVRDKLLQNTQVMGMSLAESIAREENVRLSSFKDYINFGSQYVDDIYAESAPGESEKWLQDFFGKIIDVLGTSAMDPYAVIDGEIVAANPWEGDEGYDYKSTSWYRKAIDADGEIIFTDVYRDAITDKNIITIAKELGKDGNVLAMDFYPEKYYEENNKEKLPDDCSYYLFDTEGTLLVADTVWKMSDEQLEESAKHLFAGIKDGSLAAYDTSLKGYDGKQRGAYFYEMTNGWTVVLTIPFDSVLIGEKNVVIYLLAGVGAFFFIALLVLVVKDLAQMKKLERRKARSEFSEIHFMQYIWLTIKREHMSL